MDGWIDKARRWIFEVTIDQTRIHVKDTSTHNLPRLSDVNESNECNQSKLGSIDIEISRSTYLATSYAAPINIYLFMHPHRGIFKTRLALRNLYRAPI